jgi:glycosyltransferase involved in cell wall biosynthesis
MSDRQYRLIGFSNPFNIRPAFIYPIFASLDDDFEDISTYYLEDGEKEVIEEFIEIASEQVYNFMPINAGVQTEEFEIVEIGSPTLHGYIFSDGKMIWGIEKEVKEHILEHYWKGLGQSKYSEYKKIISMKKANNQIFQSRSIILRYNQQMEWYHTILHDYESKYGSSRLNDIIQGTLEVETGKVNFGILNKDSSIDGFDPANMEILFARVPRK